MTEEYGDLDLLRLMGSRESFDKYYQFITEPAVLDETWAILEGVKEYYSTHPASTEVNWTGFRSGYLLKLAAKVGPVATGIHGQIIDALIADPKPTEKSNELVEYFVGMYHATRVREHVDKILGGRKADLEDVQGIITEYQKDKSLVAHENLEDVLCFSDMEAVYDKIYRSSGLEWRLEDLNVSVGPLHGGDQVCVVACPNVGKTRFITSEITHFVTQLEEPRILFVNNEETKEAIWNAIYCSYFNLEDDEVLKNVKKLEERWDKEVGKESIGVYQRSDATTADVERIIKAYRPQVVVYNQLYKVHLPGRNLKATEAEQYRLTYQFGREMADKYDCISLPVHQAGALAAGEKWVMQEHMYGSKTGVAGECDVIIGIGKTYDPTMSERRFINIARNKLPSGPRTIPSLREDSHFEVKFKASRGRYETIEYK